MSALEQIEQGIDSLLQEPPYAADPQHRQFALLELLKKRAGLRLRAEFSISQLCRPLADRFSKRKANRRFALPSSRSIQIESSTGPGWGG